LKSLCKNLKYQEIREFKVGNQTEERKVVKHSKGRFVDNSATVWPSNNKSRPKYSKSMSLIASDGKRWHISDL